MILPSIPMIIRGWLKYDSFVKALTIFKNTNIDLLQLEFEWHRVRLTGSGDGIDVETNLRFYGNTILDESIEDKIIWGICRLENTDITFNPMTYDLTTIQYLLKTISSNFDEILVEFYGNNDKSARVIKITYGHGFCYLAPRG